MGKRRFSPKPEQKQAIDDYLRGYSTSYKLMRLARYEQEFFGGGRLSEDEVSSPAEGPLAKAKMFEIRHFVLSLPMAGHINSLNASVACGIVLYEAARQRQHIPAIQPK